MKKYKYKKIEKSIVYAEKWNPFLEGKVYSPMPPAPSNLLRTKRNFFEFILNKPYRWQLFATGSGWKDIFPGDYIVVVLFTGFGFWHVIKNEHFENNFEPIE